MALVGDTSMLETLKYGGENKLPFQGGYSIKLPDGSVTSNIAGGMAKMQRQFLNAPYVIQCTYRTFSYFESTALEGFFKDHIGRKFIAYLAIEQRQVQPYVVQIISDVPSNRNDAGGDITITYEVENAIDRCFEKTNRELAPCMGNWMEVACITNEAIKAAP